MSFVGPSMGVCERDNRQHQGVVMMMEKKNRHDDAGFLFSFFFR